MIALVKVSTFSWEDQLKEGQIRGIHQHLEKKYKALELFKQQLENPKRRKIITEEEIKKRLKKIIKGQFIEEILTYTMVPLKDGLFSFTYGIDHQAYKNLEENVLGRKIVVTNRHDWSNEDILNAYRGQAKIEYANRCLKNPYHCALRPQYHWTDQKIEVHFLICIIGYLLACAAYTKVKNKNAYSKNISAFMEELKSIRLACTKKKKSSKVTFQMETIPKHLQTITKTLHITDKNIRPKVNISDYN